MTSTAPIRIGHVAAALGLTARTLRYWEQRGLIPPARRSRAGYRLYGEEHLRAARGVDRLRGAGLSLDEIVALVRCVASGATASAGFSSLEQAVRGGIRRLSAAIAAQQALLDDLHGALQRLARCNGCEGKPYDVTCIHCLERARPGNLPVALDSLLHAATHTSGSGENHEDN